MAHTLLIGAVYTAMVLVPCVIAWFCGADEVESSESNVLEDGFI